MQPERTTQRPSVLSVPCTACGADVGEACDNTKVGHDSDPMKMCHAARRVALKVLKEATGS